MIHTGRWRDRVDHTGKKVTRSLRTKVVAVFESGLVVTGTETTVLPEKSKLCSEEDH